MTDSCSSDRTVSFRTKTGRCHVDGEEIRLTDHSGRNFRTIYEGVLKRGSPRRRLGIVGLYLGLLAGSAWFVTAVPGAGIVLTVGLLGWIAAATYHARKHGFTDDREIPIESVDSVVAKEGMPLLTRPRFVVRYRDDGEYRRRYVLLPSHLHAGTDAAFARGKRAFERTGIDVVDADGLL